MKDNPDTAQENECEKEISSHTNNNNNNTKNIRLIINLIEFREANKKERKSFHGK